MLKPAVCHIDKPVPGRQRAGTAGLVGLVTQPYYGFLFFVISISAVCHIDKPVPGRQLRKKIVFFLGVLKVNDKNLKKKIREPKDSTLLQMFVIFKKKTIP